MAFKFGHITKSRFSDVLMFDALGSIFKVTGFLRSQRDVTYENIAFCTLCSQYFPKSLHQWLSILDIRWPWTKYRMYQLLMTVAQFSKSQQDLTCEIIAFCTLCQQYLQNYVMDGFHIWIYISLVTMDKISDIETVGDTSALTPGRYLFFALKKQCLFLGLDVFTCSQQFWIPRPCFQWTVHINRLLNGLI